MGKPARFEIVYEGGGSFLGANVIVIQDVGPWDQHFSVTNDAENVVERLVREGLLSEDRQLFYYDSEHELSEIFVKNNKFVGFSGPII